jgi:membrane-associated protein
MLVVGAIIGISSSLGYLLPAIIGLESMGVPSPGETALVLAAVLASQGKLNIELVILIGVASAIVGDNLGYFLGRKLGRDVLAGPGPFRHRRVELISAGDRFFTRHGPKAVFLARWIALVRFAAAWLAGINHMRFRQFFFWNALGGITWGITYGLVGYFLGTAAANLITEFGVFAVIALVLLVVGFLVFSQVRERRALAREEARELEEAAEGDRNGPADPGGAAEETGPAGAADATSPAGAADATSPAEHEAGPEPGSVARDRAR